MTPRNDYQIEMRLAADEIIVDSFAGGGGASLGIQWALGHGPHIAINHDREAIALHAANHPDSEHFAEDVWQVDPTEAVRGRKVGLMWLSPDCKHFSKAKGGKPVSKKIRGLAWVAVRWAKAVRPRVIVLENVEEFQTWGPVLADGKPCPMRKGHTFRRFVRRLERLGYRVDWKELRACDYGAPTIRKRLFLIARCDGLPIIWPEPTHGAGRPLPWRTAAECIDWSIECPSIFERAKPLAENTLRRIARGLRRYVIESPKPFIVPVSHGGDVRTHGINEPLRTITASSRSTHALVSPVIAGVGGRAGQSPERSVEQPYQTITAKADAALVAAHLTKFRNGATGAELTDPMPTVTANSFLKRPGGSVPMGLVGAFLKPRYGEDPDPERRGGLGQAPRARALDLPAPAIVPTGNGGDLVAAFLAKHYGGHETPGAPMPAPMSTITTQDHHHLVAAHIAKHYGDRVGSSLDEPLHTVTAESVHHALVAAHIKRDFGTSTGADVAGPLPTITSDGGGKASLVTSNLVQFNRNCDGRSMDSPMGTIMGRDKFAEVRAFLISYYGTEQTSGALSNPAPTVTPKDRLGLVTVEGEDYYIADIGMRMLQPRELYRAQGFPESYRIDIDFNGKPMTKTAQVRMVGNSVCPPLAAAIIRANVGSATFAPQTNRELVA